MRYCPHCGNPLMDLPYMGDVRLACPDVACGFVHWDNPVPVVMAVVEYLEGEGETGRILLARNRAWAEGVLGLIAGYLERHEHPAEGAVREVLEETGLVAESATLIGNYPFERKNQVLLVYHVRARGEVVLNEELAEYGLFHRHEVPPLPGAIGRAMNDWLADGAGRSGTQALPS